ncbi:jg21562 [Pararge aegeria aegeria]|uniref:Jg21562 protein n=1 Tax=Pararge aegeria aegeria TaxID=348720 RepID=A0A8S4RRH5_9NEOP|nr:jg21562 [Pararge aegeria aegeria]
MVSRSKANWVKKLLLKPINKLRSPPQPRLLISMQEKPNIEMKRGSLPIKETLRSVTEASRQNVTLTQTADMQDEGDAEGLSGDG